ncbi:MAG: amidohydrolase [Bacteroidales bacterium]|jgi:5-methylthioadenosine/S-adenosylhomocysteine deaminase
MNILIKDCFFKEKLTDILIEGNIIKKVICKEDPNYNPADYDIHADRIIDGTNKAVIAGFVNGHTHSAMTLFRGWADEMELEPWLAEKIWPYEAKLTEEMIYWGTKLACMEMIRSGTTCFNDMYWNIKVSSEAVKSTGMRATLSSVVLDPNNNENAPLTDIQSAVYKDLEVAKNFPETIDYAISPHAIYTVSSKVFKWVNDFANDNDLLIHTHLAETETEYNNSVKKYGLSPIRYLNSIGLLSPRLIIAHCLWLDDEELQMLADNDVKVIHNPNSNLKLASGYKFKFKEMKAKGITVGIGTDGCSSSNNLDMIEAMKEASLIGKAWRFDPTAHKAKDMFVCSTVNGGKILRKNIGRIKEGYLADITLLNIATPSFTPNFNFISNLCYAANGNDVDTVICNGKVLMENKKIEGMQEVLDNVNRLAHELFFS